MILKKIKFIFFIQILIFASLVFANEQDPFERELKFTGDAKYIGEQLDLTSTRNIQFLSPQQLNDYHLTPKANFVYVANFRHLGKYWIAAIPTDGVQETLFQFQNLSALRKMGIPDFLINWIRFGHIQIRFKMKPGKDIELISQRKDQPLEVAKINDFSYALNAVRSALHKNDSYEPLGDGVKNGYGLSHTFISTQDTVLFFRGYGLSVEQYPLRLTSKQSNKLLMAYLKKSNESVENEITYHTLFRSCVTETMNGLYSVVKNKPVIWWGRIWRNWRIIPQAMGSKFEFDPRAVVALLKKQNYIDQQRPMNLLENEFKPGMGCSKTF